MYDNSKNEIPPCMHDHFHRLRREPMDSRDENQLTNQSLNDIINGKISFQCQFYMLTSGIRIPKNDNGELSHSIDMNDLPA